MSKKVKEDSVDSIELTVDEMLKQAVAAHNRGNVELAERLYCTVLEVEPSHPDANHNLGVLAVSVNRAELALPLFKTAIDANPSVEQFWLSYIGALVKEKHLETAREVLEQAKKSGLSEEKIDALETQLDQIAQSALLKISERGKSPAPKEKQEEIFASKREKKKVESKNNREDKTINPLGPSKQQIGRLLELYQNGQHDEAERLARASTEQFPHDTFSWKILGAALRQKSRLPEALVACEKVVSLSPQDDQAHYNLGVALKELGKLEAAVASYERAIVLKPDSADANYILGTTLQELGRLNEAEASYRQAIALKPNYATAHSNLGVTLRGLGRLKESEASLRQAIALDPGYALAHKNLGITIYANGDVSSALESIQAANNIEPKSKEFELLLSVMRVRKANEISEIGVTSTSSRGDLSALTANPLILNRVVETGLVANLYEMSFREMNEEGDDARYGTRSSGFNLFEDSRSFIRTLADDLTRIMMEAVKSDIYIDDSFFNLLGAGGGTIPHDHLSKLDKGIEIGLGKQKYSLVYYLSVGDQDCSEPGILKLYGPDEDILPCDGMITIIPASRAHSAIYGGKTDRVMVGVNFYSLCGYLD